MPLFGVSDRRPRSVRDERLKANVFVDVHCETEDRAPASKLREQRLHPSPWTVDPGNTCATAIYARL